MEPMILLSILVTFCLSFIFVRKYMSQTSSLKFKRVFSLIAILAIVFSTLGKRLVHNRHMQLMDYIKKKQL